MGCISSRRVWVADRQQRQAHQNMPHNAHGSKSPTCMHGSPRHFVGMPLSCKFGELEYSDYRRSIDYTNQVCKNCSISSMYMTLRIGSDIITQSSFFSSTSTSNSSPTKR